jgi:hypothetical protein
MRRPDTTAPKILFAIADEVCVALPENAVARSRQALCPQTSYSTLIRSGSSCMAARRRLRRRVEARGTAGSRGAEWHGGIWRVVGEIDVEIDVLDT